MYKSSKIKALVRVLLIFIALAFGLVRSQAQTTNVYVDPTQNWIGYMTWSPNPSDPPGGGGSGASAWGTGALPAVFNGSLLTISPNVNVYSNTNDPYWVNPDGSGANIMDASFYVQNTNSFGGQTVTFSGYCQSNTLVSPYTCVAFIKDLAQGSYALVNSTTATPVSGQPFSISLAIQPGDICQYGFETVGPDANPATVASLGSVLISSNATVSLPSVPLTAAPVPTRPAGSVLALYNSSGTYSNHPVERWLAAWSGANESSFTISNTTSTVLKYSSLQYAGVEFYDTNSGDNVGGTTNYSVNATNYDTFHVDVWTPNANQFGIQLVSLNPTIAPQVNFLPASGTITNGGWISLDIPLTTFTGINPSLVLSKLQQLLWIDNQAGGGVTSGIFYLDNVYFYKSSALSPPTFNASLASGSVQLQFSTQLGANYTVQYKTNLTDATWQTLANVSGTGTAQTVADPANQKSRFYRMYVH